MSLVLTGKSANCAILSASVVALANNGFGAIRVATGATHFFGDGNLVLMNVTNSTPPVTGLFNISVIDATHFDLNGTTFGTTGTGTAQCLSLTPQIQVPTDGDTFSLQLSGMLSALQNTIDRTQFLREWQARRGVQTQTTSMRVNALQTGWSYVNGAPILLGPTTTQIQDVWLPTDLPQGSTLGSVTLSFGYPTGAPGGQPANQLKLSIKRQLIQLGTLSTPQALSSSDPQSPASIGLVATQQQFVYTCNQNNVIDNTQYHYFAEVTNCNGSGSNNTSFWAMQFGFTAGPTS